MRINIEKIEGKGFLPFKEEFQFSFSELKEKIVQIDGENLKDELSGSNGSGKSSLLETINWSLYGELCRKNKYDDEAINKHSMSGNVNVYFNKGNDNFIVKRILARKKSQELKIFKNDQEQWLGATTKTKQEELEKILGMNFIAFQCSEMFGSDFMNFPELEPAKRAKILSDIRGLDKYLEASKRANQSVNLLEQNVKILRDTLLKEEGKLQATRATSFKDDIIEWDEEGKEQIDQFKSEIKEKDCLNHDSHDYMINLIRYVTT